VVPDRIANMTMTSMTGFGRATRESAGRRIVVEIRSVNHRALDVKLRSRLAAACEVEIIRTVRAACKRGSIQVSVEEESSERQAPASPERVRSIHRQLVQLRDELGLEGPVDLGTVAAFLRLERESSLGEPPDWPELEPVLKEALSALQGTRAREGQALATEIRGRSRRLRQIVSALEAEAGTLSQRAAARLQDRLRALAPPGVDPARLAQEVALLADRLDVTEELARLAAHLLRLEELLETPGAVESPGRTLEFLIQELARELNTLGVKAQDVGVSALVIEGKAELEKVREQAQNIE
jgi:uncharacterized protein (TIGR00255 family)